jgi:hypothetical protein
MVTATAIASRTISDLITDPSLPPHLPSARRGHPSHANRRRRTCLHRNRRHSRSEARHDVIEADGSLEGPSLLAAIGPSGAAITDIDLRTENTGIDVAAAARRLWPVVRVMLFSGLPANHTGQEPDPRDVIFRSHFQAIACSELLLTRRRCGRPRRRDGAAAARPDSGRRGAGNDTNSQGCKRAWLRVSVFPFQRCGMPRLGLSDRRNPVTVRPDGRMFAGKVEVTVSGPCGSHEWRLSMATASALGAASPGVVRLHRCRICPAFFVGHYWARFCSDACAAVNHHGWVKATPRCLHQPRDGGAGNAGQPTPQPAAVPG